MTTTFYVLELTTQGVDVECWINGIPVERRGPELGASMAGPVNEHLVDGPNELCLVVRPGPTPRQACTLRRGQVESWVRTTESAEARLVRYPHGAVVGDPSGVELARITWPQADLPDEEPGEYPLVLRTTTDLGSVFGRWLWQDAPAIALDRGTYRSLWSQLVELRASMEALDPEPFLAITRPRLEDLGRAYGYDPEERAERVRRAFADHLSGPGWHMRPLTARLAEPRVCAGGRLVQCVARDGEALLHGSLGEGEPQCGFMVFLGLVDGQWRGLR